MRIRRILHPADFSAASGRAFKVAVQLARNRTALLLLHVLAPVPVVPDVYVAASVYERLRQGYEQSARTRLERLRSKAKAAGVRAAPPPRDSPSPAPAFLRDARAQRLHPIGGGAPGVGGLPHEFL